jgi:hypothetical protein
MVLKRSTAMGRLGRSKLEEAMKTLKQVMIASTILATLAVPASAKSVSEQIWDQINQTMPHRPSAEQFGEASVITKTVAEEIWDQVNQTMPHRPSVDEVRGTLP